MALNLPWCQRKVADRTPAPPCIAQWDVIDVQLISTGAPSLVVFGHLRRVVRVITPPPP